MDNDAYQLSLEALSPSRRLVFDALARRGSATDDELARLLGQSRSQVSPRRLDLLRMGLVRGAGEGLTDAGGKAQVWQVVPPAEVEQVMEQAQERGVRRLSVKKWPLDEKIAVAQVLLRDPKVYAALVDPELKNGGRHARARARQAMERDQRERTAEIKLKYADNEELGNVLKAKDHLRRAIDVVRTLGFIVDDEEDRDDARQPMVVPKWVWPQLTELLEELLGVTEQTHDRVSEHLGMAPAMAARVLRDVSPELASRPTKPVSSSEPPEADQSGATTDG